MKRFYVVLSGALLVSTLGLACGSLITSSRKKTTESTKSDAGERDTVRSKVQMLLARWVKLRLDFNRVASFCDAIAPSCKGRADDQPPSKFCDALKRCAALYQKAVTLSVSIDRAFVSVMGMLVDLRLSEAQGTLGDIGNAIKQFQDLINNSQQLESDFRHSIAGGGE